MPDEPTLQHVGRGNDDEDDSSKRKKEKKGETTRRGKERERGKEVKKGKEKKEDNKKEAKEREIEREKELTRDRGKQKKRSLGKHDRTSEDKEELGSMPKKKKGDKSSKLRLSPCPWKKTSEEGEKAKHSQDVLSCPRSSVEPSSTNRVSELERDFPDLIFTGIEPAPELQPLSRSFRRHIRNKLDHALSQYDAMREYARLVSGVLKEKLTEIIGLKRDIASDKKTFGFFEKEIKD